MVLTEWNMEWWLFDKLVFEDVGVDSQKRLDEGFVWQCAGVSCLLMDDVGDGN